MVQYQQLVHCKKSYKKPMGKLHMHHELCEPSKIMQALKEMYHEDHQNRTVNILL